MFSCVGAVPHLLHSDDRCADHARCGIPKRVLVATVNFETNTTVNSVQAEELLTTAGSEKHD